MKYKKLGNADLDVSVISLGTWVFGGDSWNGAKEDESISAVKAAIDVGINLIDTAPIYGCGLSEEIVGKAIKGKRDKIVLATKCGIISKGDKIVADLSPGSILREIDDSLRRLKVDCVDLYQCHWPDPKTPIEKTFETLKQIQQHGKIRHIGVSNFGLDLLKEASVFADIVSLQVQYSILERSIEKDVLTYCRDKGIGVITYGTLAGGILSGKYLSPPNLKGNDARSFFYKYYEGDAFRKTRKLVERLKSTGRPSSQTAINWVRQQPGVTSVIAGCRSSKQVKDNAAAASWELSEEELARFK